MRIPSSSSSQNHLSVLLSLFGSSWLDAIFVMPLGRPVLSSHLIISALNFKLKKKKQQIMCHTAILPAVAHLTVAESERKCIVLPEFHVPVHAHVFR